MGIPSYLKGNEFLKNYQKKGGEISDKNVGFEKRGNSVKRRGTPDFFFRCLKYKADILYFNY